jgi:hypothetical protein
VCMYCQLSVLSASWSRRHFLGGYAHMKLPFFMSMANNDSKSNLFLQTSCDLALIIL